MKILLSINSAKIKYLKIGKVSLLIFYWLKQIDTTPTKKYMDILCQWWYEYEMKTSKMRYYNRAAYLMKHLNDITTTIQFYDLLFEKNILDILDRDINKFMKMEYLKFNSYLKNKYKDSLTKTQIKKGKKLEIPVIYNKNGIKVYKPLNKLQCVILGKGTKWCISGSKYNTYELIAKGQQIFIYTNSNTSLRYTVIVDKNTKKIQTVDLNNMYFDGNITNVPDKYYLIYSK